MSATRKNRFGEPISKGGRPPGSSTATEQRKAPVAAELRQLREQNAALAEALRAIALALDGKRNRFGKLEGYTTEREPLRLLAVHYGTPGAFDNIEQVVYVARAALAANVVGKSAAVKAA